MQSALEVLIQSNPEHKKRITSSVSDNSGGVFACRLGININRLQSEENESGQLELLNIYSKKEKTFEEILAVE